MEAIITIGIIAVLCLCEKIAEAVKRPEKVLHCFRR